MKRDHILPNKVRKKLLLWGEKNFRRFQWREDRDPFHILLAEFMLQRTKADQVEKVYCKFLKKYPDILSLSNASLDEVQLVIASLGLYWRAKHFINAALFIQNELNGIIPENESQLKNIPGIGDYIAGVILTVCFNKPFPVIDSNIARIINRIFNLQLEGEIRRNKKIVNKSKVLFSCETPGELLFAILDFSAKICIPHSPKCIQCPIYEECNYSQKVLF